MKAIQVLLSLLCISLSLLNAKPRGGAPESQLELFTDSAVLGPVFISEGVAEELSQASQMLADYLGQISGHDWDVQTVGEQTDAPGIYVLSRSDPAAAGLWPGGKEPTHTGGAVERIAYAQTFAIVVRADRVLLIGATPEATEDAIYYFLSHYLGVKWFIPGEMGEEVPVLTRFALERESRIMQPSFLNRLLLSGRSGSDHLKWDRRNLLSRRGWKFNHNLHRIITPDLLETKPEWFIQRFGQRVPTGGGRGPNPNLLNAELCRYVAAQAVDYFAEDPASTTFSIAITDSLYFDESPTTQDVVQPFRFFRNRPVYSDLVYRFSNEVAETIWPLDANGRIDFDQVPPEAQDKFLGTLAYYWAEQVPSFPVHPRVIPYLTSDRGQWFSRAYREEDIDLIRRWCEAGPEIIGTWDYYEGSPYYVPRYFAAQAGDSIPLLYESGVRAFYAEGRAMWGFDAPRIWLAAQLLWDATLDPDALLDTFFTGYYKEVAAPMEAFFDILQQQWNNQPEPSVWIKYWQMPSQAELFPMDVWDALNELLSTAEAQAVDAKVKARLALLRTEVDFAMAMSGVYYAWKESFQQGNGDAGNIGPLVEALMETPVPNVAMLEFNRKQLIELVEPRPDQPPASADLLFEEQFSDRWLHGDTVGAGSLPFVSAKLDNGWRTRSYHNDTFRFTRSTEFAEADGIGVRIQGATYFRFSRWLPAISKATLDARLRFRGQVSPGSRVLLSLAWMDDHGELMSVRKEAEIPPGNYSEWHTLAEQTQSPAEVSWVNCGVTFLQQMPGDYLEIDWLRVTEWESGEDEE